MLLRHTATPVTERQALTIQPAKTCQPVGALYAALGIHRCMPHSHGSQGCCSYHRSALTRHYKEPVMAATSCFTEGASVFGGQANLLEAITNIFTVYSPDIIAVHTTCLSETIGDDVHQIIGRAHEENRIPEGKWVISASTPSYVGSHVMGFASMTKAMIEAFAVTPKRRGNHVTIIPGFVDPPDMIEVKRLATLMGLKVIVAPDTSGVLDTPQTGHYDMYPSGGVTVDQLVATGSSLGTIALGPIASGPAARALDVKCKVPCTVLPLPIGVRATDEYITALRSAGGVVPEAIDYERGQLLDVITDMQQYFYGKTAALIGDPDQLVSIAQFLTDVGIRVKYAVTGTPGKKFANRIQAATGSDSIIARDASDYYYLHQLIKTEKVDMVFGNTYAKYLCRDEDIPLIRTGFPIYDRIGHQYFPIVGYRGGLRLLERILSALMDRQDRDAPEESFELVM